MMAWIAGVSETPYTRRVPRGATTGSLMRRAALLALKDAGLRPSEIDGLAVASFSLAPDHAVDLAWRLGLSVNWLMDDPNGGASGLNMLSHAAAAVEAGDASAILVIAGDCLEPQRFAAVVDNFNTVTRDQLAPLRYGGPNALFAMLTLRHMRAHGLTREDYGHLVIAQRRWASLNPRATYREPLTMGGYLSAPIVAGPLSILDCPPIVSGADAVIVVAEDAPQRKRRPAVSVRAVVTSFNADHQSGDGLRTGLRDVSAELWDRAGRGPDAIDVACVYDDYPAMVLIQLSDLGLSPDEDIQRFIHSEIARRRLPLNTSGGQLSAGQAGTAGSLHGLVEIVHQLQNRGGARQVDGARTGLATGYGMTVYRYGAAAAAAILERQR